MKRPGSILMVSKPVVPPWNDSSKNLVRDIVTHAPGHLFHVLTTQGSDTVAPNVVAEPIYGEPGRYSPSLKANLKVMGHLLKPNDHAIYHFFFAPNPRSSLAARAALALRRRRSVQTVCSLPRSFEGLGRLLFADEVIAVSDSTRRRLQDAGIARVRTIPPGVELSEPRPSEERHQTRSRLGLGDGPLALFAGDYEYSTAAATFAEGVIRAARALPDAHFVFACRLKTPASREEERRIQAQVAGSGVRSQVTFLNEVDSMRDLVAAVDLQVMPADSTYAKMDLPLVLLESLAEGVPVLVGDIDPLREVLRGDSGRVVPPRDGAALAVEMVRMLRDRSMLRALGDEGRRLAAKHFDARVMARAYGDLYREMMQGPR